MPALCRLVAILVVGWLLAGCQASEPAPALLEVLAFTPAEAEVGDRLELVGSGFPEGKPATLTFRGDLHRPGKPAERGVELVMRATATSHNRISLTLTEEHQAELCGRGDDAEHTTFRGEVTAAFAPRKSGAPPVTGTLPDVVLDLVAPPEGPDRVREREAEAKRALAFIGLELMDGELSIARVLPNSRAERAGLLAGDVLLVMDGVTLRELSDLIPSGEERYAKLSVRRGKLSEPVERWVDVQGFRNAAPAELSVAAALIGLAASILLLGMFPLSRVLTWIERCTVARLGAVPRTRRRWLAPLSFAVELLARDPLPRGAFWTVVRVVPPLLFLAVSAASTALAMGQNLLGPDLDLGLLVAATLTAQVTTGLMLGGWLDARRWSLWAGLKRALAVLGCQLPAVAGIACVVMAAGTLRVREIVDAQGAMPWQWYAFKNPVLLLAFALIVVSAIPESSRASGPEHPGSKSLAFFAEWGNVLIASALCATLFLGGWRLPFSSIGEQRVELVPSVLGAVLLQLKCWALVLVVSWVRWLLPRVRVEQLTAVLLKWLLPLSVVALGLGAVWIAGLRSPLLRGLEAVFGYILFGLTAFVLVKLALRIAVGARESGTQGGVNPWI